jgi:hypothetical protein
MNGRTAVAAAFTALIGVAAVSAQECFPPCRSGFVCREGQCVSAAAAVPAVEALEKERVHADYNDGDFDAVASALESFMARNKTYAHDDSVFIAKHLAVVYTADPAKREKGKYYMYRLLDLVPSAKLIDMFVSDEIDRIFEKVREEYYVRKGVPAPEKPAFKPVPAPAVAAVEPAEEPGEIPQKPSTVAPKKSSPCG